MNGHAAVYRHRVFPVLGKCVHALYLEDSLEGCFRKLIRFHVLLIEVLLHQCLFKFKALHHYGKGHFAIFHIQDAASLVVVRFNILHRCGGEELDVSGSGKELLSVHLGIPNEHECNQCECLFHF